MESVKRGILVTEEDFLPDISAATLAKLTVMVLIARVGEHFHVLLL